MKWLDAKRKFSPRSIWFPALLRWMLLLLAAILIVPQAVRALECHATVGAESGDKGRQALAFLPNEIRIHAGDSITWRLSQCLPARSQSSSSGLAHGLNPQAPDPAK